MLKSAQQYWLQTVARNPKIAQWQMSSTCHYCKLVTTQRKIEFRHGSGVHFWFSHRPAYSHHYNTLAVHYIWELYTAAALTHHAIFNQFHDHASSCLVALCWSWYGTNSWRSTNILILWLKLNAWSRLLLNLLYHITTFTNDDTNQTSWDRNLQEAYS